MLTEQDHDIENARKALLERVKEEREVKTYIKIDKQAEKRKAQKVWLNDNLDYIYGRTLTDEQIEEYFEIWDKTKEFFNIKDYFDIIDGLRTKNEFI